MRFEEYDKHGKLLSVVDNRDLESLRASQLRDLRKYGRAILAETDWLADRAEDEPDKPVPQEVTERRIRIRKRLREIRADVEAAENLEALDEARMEPRVVELVRTEEPEADAIGGRALNLGD